MENRKTLAIGAVVVLAAAALIIILNIKGLFSEQLVGGSCGTVSPDGRDECCGRQNAGTPHITCVGGWRYDTEGGDCEYACDSSNPNQQTVGGDRDEHGCIGSAGYSWCEAKQKCLRTWEEDCPTAKACTEEAKLCPDGSGVGRNGSNNCEFDPCPGETTVETGGNTQMANPASVYCIQHNGTLRIVDEPEGQVGICTLPDGTECEEWAYMRGDCPQNTTKKEHNCTGQDRKAEACIEIYQPVCGWFNETIKCFRYPCAQTYSNSCFACIDEKVAYWTEGECPGKIGSD